MELEKDIESCLTTLQAGGLILYPRNQARAVLRHYRSFMSTAAEEMTAYAALIWTPEGDPVVGIAACYCGDVAGQV